MSDRVQLLLVLIGVREPLVSSNSNQSKDKLHRFESPPEHLLFCRFLNGDALQTVLVVLFVFLKRADYMLYRGVSFVMRSGFGAEEDYE